MKKTILIFAIILALPSLVHAQEQKEPDPAEIAEKETERLEKLLKLDDGQIFFVDSILQYNYAGMLDAMKALQRSKVTNSDIYTDTRDEWMQKTYNAFQALFTEEQWATWLKAGGAREQKARDKRKAAREVQITPKSKKKRK